jgi:hypothetical protein
MTVFSYLMEVGSTYVTVRTVLIPWGMKEVISKAPYISPLFGCQSLGTFPIINHYIMAVLRVREKSVVALLCFRQNRAVIVLCQKRASALLCVRRNRIVALLYVSMISLESTANIS